MVAIIAETDPATDIVFIRKTYELTIIKNPY